VSHNLATVQRLADRAILLKKGAIIADDTASTAVAEFHRASASMRDSVETSYRISSPHLKVEEANPRPSHPFVQGSLEVDFTITNKSPGPEPHSLFVILKNPEGVNATSHFSKDTDQSFPLDQGSQSFTVAVDSTCLLPGRYTLEAGCFDSSGACLVWAENLNVVEVLPQMDSGADFDGRTGHGTQKAKWSALPR